MYAEADVQATEALKRLQQRDEDERFYGNDKAPPARQQVRLQKNSGLQKSSPAHQKGVLCAPLPMVVFLHVLHI